MGNTAEKLAYLQETKEAIKSALIEKGQTVEDTDTFRSYAEKISAIKSGGGEETIPADKYFEGGYAEVVLPNATKIKSHAFTADQTLVNIEMPKVTEIAQYGFSNCKNLALTSLPSSLTSIGNNAFYSCDKLALTSLPSSLTSIGDSVFYSCDNVAITSIPSGVTSIGYNAFYLCKKITTLTFEGTPTSIDSTAFNSCHYLKTINVPWAEGEVANAPWGATNATINYNYTGE